MSDWSLADPGLPPLSSGHVPPDDVPCGRCSATAAPGLHDNGAPRCWACFNEDDGASRSDPTRIVTAQDFAAVKEPGADPVVGTDDEVLIPEGGDVMIYGGGGATKTTLTIDLGVHLAAGDDWLHLPIPKPRTVLMIEAEGPRPLFRQKLCRKLDAWPGSDVGDRLRVLEEPWAGFRFPDADEVAALVSEHEIDVMIAGPLTRVGMDDLGTLQQVRDFLAHVARFRTATGRRLTVILVHHDNKDGAVSGAWEGAVDTLLHAQVFAPGKTTLTIQKARWSPRWHKQKLELAWIDGEGFEVVEEADRDLVSEIDQHLAEHPHRTASEIARKRDGGIGAQLDAVKAILESETERFVSFTGKEAKALGRSSTAILWATLAPGKTGRVSESRPGDQEDTYPPTRPYRGGSGVSKRSPLADPPGEPGKTDDNGHHADAENLRAEVWDFTDDGEGS